MLRYTDAPRPYREPTLADACAEWLVAVLEEAGEPLKPKEVVDMAEAEDPDPGHYPDFNSFFTRALLPAARPLTDQPQAILSPIDGYISQIGRIRDDRASPRSASR